MYNAHTTFSLSSLSRSRPLLLARSNDFVLFSEARPIANHILNSSRKLASSPSPNISLHPNKKPFQHAIARLADLSRWSSAAPPMRDFKNIQQQKKHLYIHASTAPSSVAPFTHGTISSPLIGTTSTSCVSLGSQRRTGIANSSRILCPRTKSDWDTLHYPRSSQNHKRTQPKKKLVSVIFTLHRRCSLKLTHTVVSL